MITVEMLHLRYIVLLTQHAYAYHVIGMSMALMQSLGGTQERFFVMVATSGLHL